MGHHHHHGHDHDHEHHHHHAPTRLSGYFAIAIIANLALTIFQAVYAYIAHSTSLLADAGHNLGDVMGLVMAWISILLLKKQASSVRTYGYKKTTILASLANAVILLVACGVIARETIEKFMHPHPVAAVDVMIVAALGIVVNLVSALLFMKDSKDDLNIKAAFLHLAYDALVSVGVVIAGAIIYFTHWNIVDPIVGTVITVVILWGTWGLLKDSMHLVIDGVPKGIQLESVSEYFHNIEGVTAIHDLHIWAMSTKENALTVHLVMPKTILSDTQRKEISQHLHEQFNIHHSTIQVEQSNSHCEQGECHNGE